jgi:hypothetical protein
MAFDGEAALEPTLQLHMAHWLPAGSCPACGALAPASRVVCGLCDFVLDTTVLGPGILDDMAHLRLRRGPRPDDQTRLCRLRRA